jgi:hypothetical protein
VSINLSQRSMDNGGEAQAASPGASASDTSLHAMHATSSQGLDDPPLNVQPNGYQPISPLSLPVETAAAPGGERDVLRRRPAAASDRDRERERERERGRGRGVQDREMEGDRRGRGDGGDRDRTGLSLPPSSPSLPPSLRPSLPPSLPPSPSPPVPPRAVSVPQRALLACLASRPLPVTSVTDATAPLPSPAAPCHLNHQPHSLTAIPQTPNLKP